MKTQTIINCVFAIAFIALAVIVVAPRDATFNTITCKEWKVVDADEKVRIYASTFGNGIATVHWLDKNETVRIAAGTIGDRDVVLPTKDITPPKKP